jgi:hypothetical protein
MWMRISLCSSSCEYTCPMSRPSTRARPLVP